MNELENIQTNVEVNVLPSEGKISVAVICEGIKLSKADAGINNDVETMQHDVWTTVKTSKSDAEILPQVEVNIHEQYTLKMKKEDSGKI
jgi:hypothetical protein